MYYYIFGLKSNQHVKELLRLIMVLKNNNFSLLKIIYNKLYLPLTSRDFSTEP